MSARTADDFDRPKLIRTAERTLDQCVIDFRTLEIQRQNTLNALQRMQDSLAQDAMMSALKHGVGMEVARKIFDDVRKG